MHKHKLGSFAGLSAELLLMVIEHCELKDIAALSGVAKGYNSVCRSIIFRDVDLSIHNRGEVRCTFPTQNHYFYNTWDEPSDSLQCNNIPPNMQKRQEAFLSALIREPNLAVNVKHFSWTLLVLNSNQRTVLGTSPFKVSNSVCLDPRSPFNKIWSVFASLNNVQTLDLAWLSRDLAIPLIHSIPPILFPAATAVRLVGVMPYTLAATILLTSPRNLLHLDLDNLQQSGIIPSIHIGEDIETHDSNAAIDNCDAQTDDEPYATYDTISMLEEVLGFILGDCSDWLDDIDLEHALACEDFLDELAEDVLARTQVPLIITRPSVPIADPVSVPSPALPHSQTPQPWNNITPFGNSSDYFNAPGPMQNLLGALAGKCTSLQTLHLRKVGPSDHLDFSPLSFSKERDIYAEWALFLASVRPTLELLVIEQGERLLPRADWVQPPVRPMDQLFGDAIFPVLADGGWRRMKRVVVRGVQEWEVDNGLGNGGRVRLDGREELRGAFGQGVEVVVGRTARTADHLGVGYG